LLRKLLAYASLEVNMTSGKKHRQADESLPRIIFRKRARIVVRDLETKCGPHCDKTRLATLALEYLRLGRKMVRVPFGEHTHNFRAIDIAENFYPPFSGPDFEVIGKSDFEKSAGILMTDENFSLLQASISEARQQARELRLPWSTAEVILEKAIRSLLPDPRPRQVQRGEFRAMILEELEHIRSSRKRFRDFEDFKSAFPHFKIVEIVAARPFNEEDREYLIAPSRWETHTKIYCNGLLKKYFGLQSEETLKAYRKAYNKTRHRSGR
jgi:hypothetical protein